jgi:hypothetical protein
MVFTNITYFLSYLVFIVKLLPNIYHESIQNGEGMIKWRRSRAGSLRFLKAEYKRLVELY